MIATTTFLTSLLLAAGDGGDERVSFYANGRVRAESTFDQTNGEDRHRGRMRARVGAKVAIADGLRAEARLSTASDGNDANNPHWDFGDGSEAFQGGDIVFDRFFLDFEEGDFRARAGKMADAFRRPPVLSEVLWDNDVAPTGVAAFYGLELSDSVDLEFRLMEYIAVENGGDTDSTMFGAQCALDFALNDTCDLDFAASFSNWSGLASGGGAIQNQGNTNPMGDFDVVEGFLAATVRGGPLKKTQGFVQVMQNVADGVDEDSGFAVGVKVGESGHQGDWNGFVSFLDVDADAFFSPVSQDDTPIAGTGVGMGMQSVIAGVQYFWRDNVSFKLWALSSDADAVEDPLRIRFDIDFSVL